MGSCVKHTDGAGKIAHPRDRENKDCHDECTKKVPGRRPAPTFDTRKRSIFAKPVMERWPLETQEEPGRFAD